MNLKNEEDQFALLWAVYNNNLDAVLLLLDHGADVDSRGDLEFTALIGAAKVNNTDMVSALIKHNADINLGKTSLQEKQLFSYYLYYLYIVLYIMKSFLCQ